MIEGFPVRSFVGLSLSLAGQHLGCMGAASQLPRKPGALNSTETMVLQSSGR